jgi:hypothetical protein
MKIKPFTSKHQLTTNTRPVQGLHFKPFKITTMIQIEQGKTYKTRSGNTVEIIYNDKGHNLPFGGILKNPEGVGLKAVMFNPFGFYNPEATLSHDNDIIAEL